MRNPTRLRTVIICLAAPAVLLLFADLGKGAGTSAGGLPIAKDGKPAIAIILASDPIAAEPMAVQELADYLERSTGAKFAVVEEKDARKQGAAIHVGVTWLAREHGLDPATWGPERWAVQRVGDNLILVGGRPRGTLYAVYHFLEEVVGVRWMRSLRRVKMLSAATLALLLAGRPGSQAWPAKSAAGFCRFLART